MLACYMRVRLQDTRTPKVLIDTYEQVRVKTCAGGNTRECEWKRARVQAETRVRASGNARECEWKCVRVERVWKQGLA